MYNLPREFLRRKGLRIWTCSAKKKLRAPLYPICIFAAKNNNKKEKKIIVICRNLMETRVSSYPGITRRLLEDFKPKLDSLVLGSPKCYEYPLENTLNFEYSLGIPGLRVKSPNTTTYLYKMNSTA